MLILEKAMFTSYVASLESPELFRNHVCDDAPQFADEMSLNDESAPMKAGEARIALHSLYM